MAGDLRLRQVTGIVILMWGSDDPHDEGTFSHSQEAIDRSFTGIPEDEMQKIVGENAARLCRFPMD